MTTYTRADIELNPSSDEWRIRFFKWEGEEGERHTISSTDLDSGRRITAEKRSFQTSGAENPLNIGPFHSFEEARSKYLELIEKHGSDQAIVEVEGKE